LLQRAIEDELLVSGDIARECRTKFVTVLRGGETPANLPQANVTGKGRRLEADEGNDWMSTDAAAQLLNLSPNKVKKLLQDGKLGDADIGGHGVTRLERTAVLLCYQQMQRR
jgi:excisionase family DNA binding protein